MAHATFKPRNKHMHDLLTAKRRASGEHEPKEGKHLNRARRKEQFRSMIVD
jgi:hypothetical protein